MRKVKCLRNPFTSCQILTNLNGIPGITWGFFIRYIRIENTSLKKILLISLSLPIFCHAQKLYLQAGAGYKFPSSSANQGYAIELSTGIKIGSYFRLGIGSSYLEENFNPNPNIPVYADFKLVGKGIIKPYVFFQPGYDIYKSNVTYFLDHDGNYTLPRYMTGRFCFNQGIGLKYKYAFLQAGFRILTYYLDDPYSNNKTLAQYTFGLTAGFAIP